MPGLVFALEEEDSLLTKILSCIFAVLLWPMIFFIEDEV
jgi:hypothetical protein